MKFSVEWRQTQSSKLTWWHTYLLLLEGLVSSEDTVLDLGCGWRPDRHCRALDSRAGMCVGVDVDHRLTQQVLRHKLLSDAHYLPFAGATFDVVSSVWVLEHIENPVQMFSEVARVLRPGGTLLLITPSSFSPLVVAAKLIPHKLHQIFIQSVLGDNGRDFDNAPVFYRANTRDSLRRICGEAGFAECRAIHLSGMYEYVGNRTIRGMVLKAGNLLTDNRAMAFMKAYLVLIATKPGN